MERAGRNMEDSRRRWETVRDGGDGGDGGGRPLRARAMSHESY